MEVIFELANAGIWNDWNGGGGDPMLITTPSTAAAKPSVVIVVPEAPPPHGHHAAAGLLLRGTTQRAPRAPAAWTTTAAVPGRKWRCRVCQVECGGRDGFREHCMSDEHYRGLQLFCLRPDLFADHRIDVV